MDIADNIARALLARFKMTPEAVTVLVRQYIDDAHKTQQAVVGARQGFIDVVAHFNARLDAIEATQKRILAVVDPDLNVPNFSNGADHDGPTTIGTFHDRQSGPDRA